MNHTPGPWCARGNSIRPASGKGSTGGYAPLAVVQHDKRLPDNDAANAKLIAAAPELLKWAIEYTSNVKPGESGADYATRLDTAFNELRCAIAKATA